jgi:hypothetical protein
MTAAGIHADSTARPSNMKTTPFQAKMAVAQRTERPASNHIGF